MAERQSRLRKAREPITEEFEEEEQEEAEQEVDSNSALNESDNKPKVTEETKC